MAVIVDIPFGKLSTAIVDNISLGLIHLIDKSSRSRKLTFFQIIFVIFLNV